MTRTALTALAVAGCLLALVAPAGATSRIKDLANIEGVRQNQLIGYGLVVGLNGTGDTLNNIPFTKQSLQAMLERMGVNIRGAQIRTGNVAAVMVTANLPPFGTQGTRIDVTVSALGDAKSLQGGTLLVTPLLGADGNVYAVGQGSVAIGGFQVEGDAAKITRGVPTVGRIANGAIIEREIDFALNRLMQLRLALRNADLTTAKRIASAINDFLGAPTAEPLDPATVQLTIPAKHHGNVVALLTEIEQLQVEPDLAAKVVIDERSGVIVMGRDVRVSTVAVAQGNLTVTIAETPQVSQPNPFSRGRTVVVPRTKIGVTEDGKKLAIVNEGVSLQQLVDGLNALGIGPRDMIAILQAIKAARQDSSFKSTSYSIDANTIGIANPKNLTFQGGSVGTTAVNVALQSNTGGTPVAATAGTLAGTAVSSMDFTQSAATAGTVAFNAISGTPIDFTGAAATAASLTGTDTTNGAAGIYKGGAGIDLTANAADKLTFKVNGTLITLDRTADTDADNKVSHSEAQASIQSQLTSAAIGVNVAAQGGKLVFSTTGTGYASSVAITNITASGANVAATDLGFQNGDTANGKDAVTPVITFNVAIDGGSAQTVTINKAQVQAVGNNDAKIDSINELKSIIDNQLGSNVTVGITGGNKITFTSNTTGNSSSVAVTGYNLAGVTAHPAVAFTDTTGALQSNTTNSGANAVNPLLTFDVNVDGGATQTVRVDQAAVAAVGNNNNTIDNVTELRDILRSQLNGSVTVNNNGSGGVTLTSATTGSSSEVKISGLTATGVANNSGLANNDVFGTAASVSGGTNTVLTVDQLVNSINTNASLTGKVKASNDSGKLNIQNLSTEDLSLTGIAAGTVNGSNSTTSVSGNSVRKNLITQFNQLRSQLDKLADDASFNGVNLLHGDTLKLVFNETNTSSISIVSQNANGINNAVLGIGAASGTEFSDNAQLDTRSDALSNALTQLRSQSSAFGSNLSIVQNRQDFTKSMINTQQTGSDNLVLADTNEEAANLLALQTRQQLSTTALSLANQSAQAVLRLF